MIFTKTTVVRALCYMLCATAFFTNDIIAQDRSPDVRITLDQAKEKAAAAAMSNAARLSIDAAKYHRQAAQADYFPKLSADFLDLHYNKFMGQTIQLFRRQASLPLFGKDETVIALTVVQPVTQLLQVKQAVTIARADEGIARAKVAQQAAQMSENVERVYFGLLIAQRRQIVAEKKVEGLDSGSPTARTVAMPSGNRLEHQVALLEAGKELASAESEVSDLTQSLNALLGFSEKTRLVLDVPEPAAETISLPQATQRGVDNSPEVVEAEQTLVKARAASRLSRLEYVPSVAVMGAYITHPQPVLPLLPNDFSFIGFTATFNIFDFGKREKTVSERNAQVGLAEANVAMVKSKVAANVQKSYFELQSRRKIRDLTRQLAAGYQAAALENVSARAAAEAEMFQAELEYRSAFAQWMRHIDGR